MNSLKEAFANALNKHPIAITIISALAATSAISSVAGVFTTHVTPKEMACTLSNNDTDTGMKITFGFGVESHTSVRIPADQLQSLGGAPVKFDCVAK